jgi:hypothetical protein
VGAVALAPETLQQRASMGAYRPLRVRVEGDTAGYVGAAAAGFASFAVFALFTSLAPEFVGGTLHHASRALAGVIVFAVFGAAAAAQTLTSHWTPWYGGASACSPRPPAWSCWRSACRRPASPCS